MQQIKPTIIAMLCLLLASCSSQRPMATVDYVDIQRFMGDWYVIANIPTFLEKGAHNPIESYQLEADGTIATTFSFNADSFDGEKKTYHPRGFIKNTQTNAEWGMQFLWPIKADYRIVYLDVDYQYTVVGRNNRDYVWIMARSPIISVQKYTELEKFVAALGYNPELLEKAPHQIAGAIKQAEVKKRIKK